MTTTPVTDLLCPSGPYTVRVTTHTKAKLLEHVAEYGEPWPVSIEAAYTEAGYTDDDLPQALHWRAWLITLIGADWHARDDDDFPVQITPPLHRPAALIELRGFEPAFLDLTIAIEQAHAAQQPTAALALVAEAEALLDQWKERARFYQAQIRPWRVALSGERPKPDDDDDEAALIRFDIAARNVRLIAGTADTALNVTIDRWRGVADEIAQTGRFPDGD